MRPHQIITKRPDGTLPFSRTVLPDEKPGTYFQQQDALAKERQTWEQATVERLKAKPRNEWDDKDNADFEALKWPSLQDAVRLAHAGPVVASLPETPTTTSTADAPAPPSMAAPAQPTGTETNGAAVQMIMRDAPRPPAAPAFTAENTPEATPVMLEILNSAPAEKQEALLVIVRQTSTPAAARIPQMKGLLKNDA